MAYEKEIKRINDIILHNKFINDLSWRERGNENLVLETVLDLDFNKKVFWEHLEKAGLKEEEKILVENILTTHNIKLKEVEEIES